MKFSDTEKEHLLKAWLALSFAFTILSRAQFDITFFIYFIISLSTVGLAFLLHEIAHKYVAQRYGCWAEFRADDRMLVFAVLSAFLGFIFAAPGAVIIQGKVTTERNGKISLAGPATNLVLATLFLAVSFFVDGLLYQTAYYGYWTNSFIGLFNMIPALNFDGAKIISWNKIIYFVTVGIALILTFLPV